MAPTLRDLIGRDLDAIEADLELLRSRVEIVRAARNGGDLHVIPHRTAMAEEVARRIRDRLVEIGLQTANATNLSEGEI